MALATHFLTAFVLIVGFAFLLHISGEPVDDFEADSWTAIVSRWSMPAVAGDSTSATKHGARLYSGWSSAPSHTSIASG